MKTLLLMRHAKSSWKDHDLEDIERPLTKRGRSDAPEMGALLKKKKLAPQVILTSHARRAFKTAGWVADELKMDDDKIQIKKNLYLAETEDLIKELKQVSDDLDSVLVIGHNPGLEALAQLFTDKIISMPTASIAHLTLPLDKWSDLDADTEAELVEQYYPSKKEKKDKKEKK